MRIRHNARDFHPAPDVVLGQSASGSVSYSSPRVNGRLQLRQNPYSAYEFVNRSYSMWGQTASPLVPSYAWMTYGSTPEGAAAMASADNQARARFFGLLRQGGSNLGVTLAQYRESREMIVDRSDKLRGYNQWVYTRVQRNRRYWTRKGLLIPGWHLEFIFGWQPLCQDLWNAANSVIQLAEAQGYAKGTGRGYAKYSHQYTEPNPRSAGWTSMAAWHLTATSKVAARYTVPNPNAYLANRAGLVNPGLVVWDAIPFSFLVNMFVNVNALISQITDDVGIHLEDISVTRKGSTLGTNFAATTWERADSPGWAAAASSWSAMTKNRSLGEIPAPTLEFRLPSVDWGGAAMLASLAVMQLSGLGTIRKLL